MREKARGRIGTAGTPSNRIRADLERRGVAPEFSQPVADRIAAIAPDLTPEEYAGVLSGVAAAYGVHRQDAERQSPDAHEMERLMSDFAGELRKLDEGLRVLSAYLVRIRGRSLDEAKQTLH